jgi:thiosulfate reductase cytochrome b subunit
MAEATQEEIRAHTETYNAFNKLVLFVILWVILLLSSMALGLVAHVGILSVLLGIGGTVVLLIGFAVLG